MKTNWQQRSREVHERFLKLARKKGNLTSEAEIVNFLALAICGEAGELANLIKKRWRGDDINQEDIRDEIADIRIYLEHLSRHLKIDIDQACEAKIDQVSVRLHFKELGAKP